MRSQAKTSRFAVNGFVDTWKLLASVFGIDVLTYATMSNQMRLILRDRPDVVAAWSDQEEAILWLRMFPGRRLEEHLAEPTENDVNMLVNQPDRMRLTLERLTGKQKRTGLKSRGYHRPISFLSYVFPGNQLHRKNWRFPIMGDSQARKVAEDFIATQNSMFRYEFIGVVCSPHCSTEANVNFDATGPMVRSSVVLLS